MKGSPQNPQCGFSQRIVALLNSYIGSAITGYDHFDIFSDEAVRTGMKTFSNWQTFPQLYVNGTFVGGLDVCLELHEAGELEEELAKSNVNN